MFADKVLVNFSQIFSPIDKNRALRGSEMNEAMIIENGYIAIKGGKILEVGEGYPEQLIGDETQVIDYTGKLASPGLIDCHTHLVYGGSREDEFAKKLNGMSYLEILEEGGGILSTVKRTKESDFDQLYDKSARLLEYMLSHGVTAVEAKSGYGLEWETEKKQMEVVKKLNADQPIEIISTFMGAHAIPTEYNGDGDQYIDDIIKDMLPKVVEEDSAEFCDVFCEVGVFNPEQSRRLLEAAKEHGLKLRIHTDEIESIGGVDVAAELSCHTAEHLMMIKDEDIDKLADSGVIGAILPGTTFSLMEDTYAPARKMLDRGMAIALSTDSNPGSCPTANIQFIMQLGCFKLKLTPIEVFNSVTVNAAHAIDRGEELGTFKRGKRANITIFDAPNIDYPLYFFATNLVQDVYIDGNLVVEDFCLKE